MNTSSAQYTTETGATYRAFARHAFANPENVMPAMADYVVVNFVDQTIGHIVDTREDDPKEAKPFEAFSESGQYITSAESLKGAMWAVVSAWEETRHNAR